jgi:hypothetical protein
MTRCQNLGLLLPVLHQSEILGNQLLKELAKTDQLLKFMAPVSCWKSGGLLIQTLHYICEKINTYVMNDRI